MISLAVSACPLNQAGQYYSERINAVRYEVVKHARNQFFSLARQRRTGVFQLKPINQIFRGFYVKTI